MQKYIMGWGALSLAILLGGQVSFAQEEPFVCGTEDPDLVTPLRKSANHQPGRDSEPVAGTIHVVTLRAAFSDSPNDITEEELSEVNADVSRFMAENSKGLLEMTFSIHPTVFTYSGTADEAEDDFGDFENWLDEQVEAAGLERGVDWDRWIVNFPQIGVPWSGRSRGSRRGSNYTNGRYSRGLVAHELGHAIGLPHATALEAGEEIVGSFDPDLASEERVEYGDVLDVMGYGGMTGHYNTRYKSGLGWVDEGVEVIDITAAGAYRIHAHDNPERSGEVLALRIRSGDSDLTYWVEYRTNYSFRRYNSRQGVLIRLTGYWEERTAGRTTAILDMTPGSQRQIGDFRDAALEVGETYADKFGGFSITTTAINDGVWDHNGWAEVRVDMETTSLKPRHRRPQVAFKGTPWEAGYKVYDLKSRAIPRAESLNRGLYIILQGGLPESTSPRLYYQE